MVKKRNTRKIISRISQTIIGIHDLLVELNHDPKELRAGANLEFIVFDALRKFNALNIDASIHIMKALAEKHPFIEGNKRTAYIVGKTLLFQNGKLLCLSDNRAVQYMKILAKRKEQGKAKSFQEVKNWVLQSCEDTSAETLADLRDLDNILQKVSKVKSRKIRKYLRNLVLLTKRMEEEK